MTDAPKFKIRDLSVLSYAQGYTAWHYKAVGIDLADMAVVGFFDACGDMLNVGDTLTISARDGVSIVYIAKAGKAVAVKSIVPFPENMEIAT